MKATLNSLFLQQHLTTVKLAAIYCDEIVLPDFINILMDLTAEIDESRIKTARPVARWLSVLRENKVRLQLIFLFLRCGPASSGIGDRYRRSTQHRLSPKHWQSIG